MPRYRRNTKFLGPTSICDACGKPGWDCHTTGMVCYFCQGGVFMGRWWWVYTPCPDCRATPWPTCEACHGAGVIATPREDLSLEQLRAEWRKISAAYIKHREPLPELVAERLRWAGQACSVDTSR